MADKKPLSDERLAGIRRYLDGKREAMRVIDLSHHQTIEDVERERLHYFASELLAEVERQRAREAAIWSYLDDQVAASRDFDALMRFQFRQFLEDARKRYGKQESNG